MSRHPQDHAPLFGRPAIYEGLAYTVCANSEPEDTHIWLAHPEQPQPIFVPRDSVRIGNASILHDFLAAGDLLDVDDMDLISTAEYDHFFAPHAPYRHKITEDDVLARMHLYDDAMTRSAIEDTEAKVTELVHGLGHIDALRYRAIRDLINHCTVELIDGRVSDIAHGIALGALDFDSPVIHDETGDALFGQSSAHDLLRTAGHDEEILERLIEDYTSFAEELVALIPTDTLVDPDGHERVCPGSDNWVQVGVELYLHHNLPLETTDLTITPNRRDGIYTSHITGSVSLELVLITTQRTHRVSLNHVPPITSTLQEHSPMARRILHIEPTDAQWRAIDSLHNPFIQVEGESTDDGPVLLRVTEIIDDFEVAVSTIDPDGDIVTREVLNGYHQGWTAYDIEDEVDETFYERLHNPTNFATEVRLDEIGADGEYANVLQVQSTLTESTDTMTHRQIQDRAMEVLGELITDPVIVDEENWIVRAGGRDFRLSYRTVEKVTEES